MNIWFNGISAEDLGIVVEAVPEEIFPERRGETQDVPGRHGVVEAPDDTYRSYIQPYKVHFKEPEPGQVRRRAREIAQWLLGSSGFCRLEDGYEPDHFRLARFAGPMNVEILLRRWGSCELQFECQPQRYRLDGEEEIRIPGTADVQTIVNPTMQEALPLIRLELDRNQDPDKIELTRALVPDNSGVNQWYGYIWDLNSGYSAPIYSANSNGYRVWTTVPVNVEGYYLAHFDACAYVFSDGSGNVVGGAAYRPPEGGYRFGKMHHFEVEIPSGAVTLALQTMDTEGDPTLWLHKCSYPEAYDKSNPVSIGFGNKIIRVDMGLYRTVYLDSALQNAWFGDGSDANDAVDVRTGAMDRSFPRFAPGENTVRNNPGAASMYRTGLAIYVTPRWWDL